MVLSVEQQRLALAGNRGDAGGEPGVEEDEFDAAVVDAVEFAADDGIDAAEDESSEEENSDGDPA